MQDGHQSMPPTLFWLRRDLRLGGHPGWHAALEGGGPVIPVFILDPIFASYGAAPKWRLGESLADLGGRSHAVAAGSSCVAAKRPRCWRR